MRVDQEFELRKVVASALGQLSAAAACGNPISPETAGILADQIEAGRIAAGWEPLQLAHKEKTQ